MKKVVNNYQRIDKRGIFNEYLNSGQSWKSINGGAMKRGALMGNHYHKKCLTLFFIVSGSAEVFSKNLKGARAKIEKIKLKDLEGVLLNKYETHAWRFLKDSSFLLLKSNKYNENNKDIYESVVMPGKKI